MAASRSRKPISRLDLPANSQALVGIKELAKILSVTQITLRRWDASGNLPKAIRVGPQNHRRWLRTEIDSWLLERARKAVANG